MAAAPVQGRATLTLCPGISQKEGDPAMLEAPPGPVLRTGMTRSALIAELPLPTVVQQLGGVVWLPVVADLVIVKHGFHPQVEPLHRS